MIELVNLKSQYQKLRTEILEGIDEVISSSQFIQGPFAKEFESHFLKANHSKFGVGCSNGTSAITLALQALGVGSSHEVITTTNTFIATAEAICSVGAKPVFCDIDPQTYTMDTSKIPALINSKTKAIIAVHIYGNPCNMQELQKIAKEHNLLLIEDSAQAHFGKYQNTYIGNFGDAATYSFYPGKNLGAYGDAGFVITKEESTLNTVKKLLDHGRLSKYSHDIIGQNNRIDAIQAKILNIKMKYIFEWNQIRQRMARYYDSVFIPKGIKTMTVYPEGECVYHVYPVRVKNREITQERLKDLGISTGVHYPIPLHLQPAFKYLDYKPGDFPVAEEISKSIMSLPICPEITKSQSEFIAEKFIEVTKNV